MGSSDSGQGSGVVDCSIGTIVWVRRRNGSWWPGKILGPDELSASHLMSPRSGTPVKLLGREDASVDWYNLEKSKRVKAFRCGEFEDCIERAESSQGMPVKKREKYARREDAILHALELESKQMNLGIASESTASKLSDPFEKELVADESGKIGLPKLNQSSKKIDSSLEDDCSNHPLHEQNSKEEDDNVEITPRMRGLQDFGLRIAPSKKNVPSVIASNGSTNLGDSKSSLQRRKRASEELGDESFGKRPDKRLPLLKVLQSSGKLRNPNALKPDKGTVSPSILGKEQVGVAFRAKRSRCLYLPAESGDCVDTKRTLPTEMEFSSAQLEEDNTNDSGCMEETVSDSSGTESLDTDTDGEMISHSDVPVPNEAEPNDLIISELQVEHGSMSSEDPDESLLTPPIGVSKWQLKGKRNNRNLNKRYLESEKSSKTRFVDHKCNRDEADMIGFDSKKYLASKSASRSHNIIDWDELAWDDQPSLRGYWEDQPLFVGRNNPIFNRKKSGLVDIELKVQATYQREHVPIVSLMSRLNGKAIIGHPIQIESLEDGSVDTLLSSNFDIGNEALDDCNNTSLQPVWKTARRTANFRVPRPRHQSTTERKLSRKPSKKVSSSSSQKTRTLSSIAVDHKVKNKPKVSSIKGNSYMDGLIKRESGPTTIACIPVKLVFSRLHEAVSRPPSRAAAGQERNP